MSGWTGRTRTVPGPRGLEAFRDAAQDLADHAGHPPGPGGTPFRIVYNMALLATVSLSGTLAAVHLWQTLFPKHRADRHELSHDPDQRRTARGGCQLPHQHHAVGDGTRARERLRGQLPR